MDKNQSDKIHSKFYHNHLPNFLHPNLNLFTIFSPHIRSSDKDILGPLELLFYFMIYGEVNLCTEFLAWIISRNKKRVVFLLRCF